jgi:hypothetical protein
MNLNRKILEFSASRVYELANFLRQNWIAIIGSLFVIIVLLVPYYLNWEFWAEQTYDQFGKLKEAKVDRAKVAQQLVLLILAAIGLVLAVWRSITAHQQAQAALKQAEIGVRQVEAVERNQNVERYAKAALMLESDRLAVRQAGIYSLRELALFDPTHHGSISAKLIASFIRFRCSEDSGDNEDMPSRGDVVDGLLALCEVAHTSNQELRLHGSVFRKLNELSGLTIPKNISFANTSWINTNLNQSTIPNSLWEAKIRSSGFVGCDFVGVDFYDAQIERTRFEGVDFSYSSFVFVNIQGCTFKNCNFSGAQFYYMDSSPLPADMFNQSWAWSDRSPGGSPNFRFDGDLYFPGENDSNKMEFEADRLNQMSRAIMYPRRPDEKWKI